MPLPAKLPDLSEGKASHWPPDLVIDPQKKAPPMAGASLPLWEVSDMVKVLEDWERA